MPVPVMIFNDFGNLTFCSSKIETNFWRFAAASSICRIRENFYVERRGKKVELQDFV